MDKHDYFGLFATFIVLPITIWFIGSAMSASQERVKMETEACEKSGGVYIDNMRRVGKTTSHEYMCMKKNLFILPEGE